MKECIEDNGYSINHFRQITHAVTPTSPLTVLLFETPCKFRMELPTFEKNYLDFYKIIIR